MSPYRQRQCALDVARILGPRRALNSRSDIVTTALDALSVSSVSRIPSSGGAAPSDRMTPKELGELGHLERAQPFVAAYDPCRRRATTRRSTRPAQVGGLLRAFAALANGAAKPVTIAFDFFARPRRRRRSARVRAAGG